MSKKGRKVYQNKGSGSYKTVEEADEYWSRVCSKVDSENKTLQEKIQHLTENLRSSKHQLKSCTDSYKKHLVEFKQDLKNKEGIVESLSKEIEAFRSENVELKKEFRILKKENTNYRVVNDRAMKKINEYEVLFSKTISRNLNNDPSFPIVVPKINTKKKLEISTNMKRKKRIKKSKKLVAKKVKKGDKQMIVSETPVHIEALFDGSASQSASMEDSSNVLGVKRISTNPKTPEILNELMGNVVPATPEIIVSEKVESISFPIPSSVNYSKLSQSTNPETPSDIKILVDKVIIDTPQTPMIVDDMLDEIEEKSGMDVKFPVEETFSQIPIIRHITGEIVPDIETPMILDDMLDEIDEKAELNDNSPVVELAKKSELKVPEASVMKRVKTPMELDEMLDEEKNDLVQSKVIPPSVLKRTMTPFVLDDLMEDEEMEEKQ